MTTFAAKASFQFSNHSHVFFLFESMLTSFADACNGYNGCTNELNLLLKTTASTIHCPSGCNANLCCDSSTLLTFILLFQNDNCYHLLISFTYFSYFQICQGIIERFQFAFIKTISIVIINDLSTQIVELFWAPNVLRN